MTECRHSFALYLQGAETPHFRKLLVDNHAKHVGINFKSLLPRMNKARRWSVEEHFPPEVEVLVDAGGFGTKAIEGFDHDAHSLMYQRWVEANADRISLVVEYDAPIMGQGWLEEQRTYWDDLLPKDKYLPVWHEEFGIEELERLAGDYPRVAVSKPSGGTEGRLRGVVARTGLKLHGLGLSSPDDIEQLPLATASSTSWISPSRYGDTQVFTGGRFHWYPARSKKDARARHRHDVDLAGFDGEAFEAGDAPTVAKYTIWAWQQFENDVVLHRSRPDAEIVAITRPVAHSASRTQEGDDVAQTDEPLGSPELIIRPRDLPFPGLNLAPLVTAGEQVEGAVPQLIAVSSDAGLRRCNSCALSSRCPVYAANSTCAFKLQVEVRTKDQLQATMSLLLEMQLGRIMFARANEEAMGQPVSKDVTAEIESYFKMVAKWKEIETDSTFLSIKASGPSAGGLISSLLGQARGAEARSVAQAIDPTKAERVIRNFLDIEE